MCKLHDISVTVLIDNYVQIAWNISDRIDRLVRPHTSRVSLQSRNANTPMSLILRCFCNIWSRLSNRRLKRYTLQKWPRRAGWERIVWPRALIFLKEHVLRSQPEQIRDKQIDETRMRRKLTYPLRVMIWRSAHLLGRLLHLEFSGALRRHTQTIRTTNWCGKRQCCVLVLWEFQKFRFVDFQKGQSKFNISAVEPEIVYNGAWIRILCISQVNTHV